MNAPYAAPAYNAVCGLSLYEYTTCAAQSRARWLTVSTYNA